MDTLKHKEFEGSIEVSVEDRCLHGKLLFVGDLVTYQGRDVDELEQSFREAVEDYITFCAEVGKVPEKPYKGAFNVRVKPEVHKALVMRAYREQVPLNELVCRAFEVFLGGCVEHSHHHHHHVVVQEQKAVKWMPFRAPSDADLIVDMTVPADERNVSWKSADARH